MWEMIERMATDRLWIYTVLIVVVYLEFTFYCLHERHKNRFMGFWQMGPALGSQLEIDTAGHGSTKILMLGVKLILTLPER